MDLLPLYLTGDAFLVWEQLSDVDREDEDQVKKRLQESFTLSSGEAYIQFTRRRKKVDETVDAYLSDLRRLLKDSGHTEKADGKDPMLQEQFLSELPLKFASQLRLSVASSGPVMISSLVSQARALVATETTGPGGATAAATGSSRPPVACCECQQTGHLRRDCPRRRDARKCFQCGQSGHLKRDCPNGGNMPRKAEKSAQTAVAAETGCKTSAGKYLGAVADTDVTLPHVYVNVAGCGERPRAAIDSCSTRSLVCQSWLAERDFVVSPESTSITAIDGLSLDASGKVLLTLSRQDDVVDLPQVEAEFLVVESLSVVDAELLIGLDVA